MTPRYLLPLCLALLFFGCGEKLPKPTQTGSNTFGCKVDGKKWEPDGRGGLFSGIKPLEGNFTWIDEKTNRKGITITARKGSNGDKIQLFLDSIEPKIYQLNQNTNSFPANNNAKSYGLVAISSGQRYITSTINSGIVIIDKADTVSGIISGQFYFKVGAVDLNGKPNGAGTVNVTEGRFDIKSPL